MNRRNIALFILLFLFIAATLCYNVVCLGRYLDSDMYGDIWISKLMCEQKTPFPKGWTFGNQVYLLSTPNISALLYGITGDLLLSMGCASSLMVIITVLAFVYCFKRIATENAIIIGLISFFACFYSTAVVNNEFGQLFIVGCTYYSCYAITFLISLGVYQRIIESAEIKGNYISAILAIVMTFAMGVQSLRQMVIMVLPLIMFEGIYEIRRFFQKKKVNGTALLFVLILFISNLIGIFLSKSLPIQKEEIYGGLTFDLFQNLDAKLKSTISIIISLFGLHDLYLKLSYNAAVSIGDFTPIIGALGLLMMFFVFFSKCTKPKDVAYRRLFPAIFILEFSVLGTFASLWLFDITGHAKYLFVFFLLIPVVAMFVFENLTTKSAKKMKIILSIIASIVLLASYINPLLSSFTNVTAYDRVASCMKENGYDIVYAVWADAGAVAGASDCTITAGRWDASSIFKIKTHTNVFGIYNEEDNERACYLFNKSNIEAAKEYLGDEFSLLQLLGTWKNGSNDELFLYRSEKQLMHN